jgi:hypothetical protein
MTPDPIPTALAEAGRRILDAHDDKYLDDIAAGKYGKASDGPTTEPQAEAQPQAAPTPGKPARKTMADVLRERMLTGAAFLDIPPQPPLVEGVLFHGTASLLIGPPKKGKTFLAIDLVGAVLTGRPWQGRSVHADPDRPVVWLAGEGLPEVGRRLRAWSAHHGVSPDLLASRMHVLPGGLSLQEAPDRLALVEVLTDLNPQLIVIDTYARHTRGLEENSNRDSGLVVEALDALTAATGGHVMVVHHTGKDPLKGARGANALIGAVETELTITGDVPNLTVRNTAQRTTAEVPQWYCQLVEAGADLDRGEHLSMVATVTGSPPATTDDRLGKVIEIVRALDQGAGVHSTTLMAEVKDTLDIGRTAAHEAVAAAVKMGSLTKTQEGRTFRYALAFPDLDTDNDDNADPMF